MKYKIMIIMILTVFVMFAIAGVSAGDADDAAIASADTNGIQLSQNGEMELDNLKATGGDTPLKQANDERIISGKDAESTGALTSGQSTFEELKMDIGNGGDINLSGSYYRYSYSAWDFSIEITQPGVINGNGAVIDMEDSENLRIFHVTCDGVTFKNITFMNANYGGDGAAIYFEKGGSVIDCNFYNNTAKSSNSNTRCKGGAVYFHEGVGIVSGCNFTGNTANGDAGAVYFYYGYCVVSRCSFISNSATSGFGGAFRIESSNCVVNDCNFTGNNASDYGGAVYIANGNVSGCRFTCNSADAIGGAIWASGNTNIIDCRFDDNYADRSAASFLGSGGSAIGCNFVGNRANYWVIELYATDSFIVSDCILVNNSANKCIVHVNNLQEYYSCSINNNIFLNSNCSHEILFDKPTNSNIDCNWFGHNATDYESGPRTEGMNATVWLFLNATATPKSIKCFNSSDIGFGLYAYNKTSGNVTEYDSALLKPINLTLSSTKGDVDKKVVGLGEPIKFTADAVGEGRVKATVENVAFAVGVDVIRFDSGLSVENQMVTYGDAATLALKYDPNATGKVNITLTGKNHREIYLYRQLNAVIALSNDILPDEYDVLVSYSGDEQFLNATANAKLTVNPLASNIAVEGYSINVTDSHGAMFTVTLPENATGSLNMSNGLSVNVTECGRKENSALLIDIMNDAYAVGQYNWTFTYCGDDIYGISTANASSNILIVKSEIIPANKTIDLFVEETADMDYALSPAGFTSDITFSSSNSSVVIVDSTSGKIQACKEGSALISIIFAGNANFTPSNATVRVNVKKVKTEIGIENNAVNLSVGDSVNAGAALMPDGAGNLTYASSNSSVVKVENGKIVTIGVGDAVITVSFAGDYRYAAAENATIVVTVSLKDAVVTVDSNSLELIVGKSFDIHPTTAPEDLNVKVASSNESVVRVEIVNRIPKVTAVGEGSAIITLSIDENDYFKNSTEVFVTVKKENLTIEATADPITVGENATVVVTGLENATGDISVRAGNGIYISPIVKGTATVVIPGLVEDTVAEVRYSGDGRYNNASASAVIAVSLIPSALDVNGTDIYHGNDAVLNYTAVNAIGIDVVVSDWLGRTLAEGDDYNISKTDSQIIIRFFDDGTFTVNVTTLTDSNHTSVTRNVTVHVNPICDLEVVLTPMNSTAHYGDTVTWNATIINHGPSYPFNLYIVAYASEGLIFDIRDGYADSNHCRLSIPFTLYPDRPFMVFLKTIVNASDAALKLNVSVSDSYFPDPNSDNNNASATVRIEYATASLDVVADGEISAGDNLNVDVALPVDSAGSVTVSANGKNYTADVKDGKAKVTVPDLGVGNNALSVIYSGDKKYSSSEKVVFVTVNKIGSVLKASKKTFKVEVKAKKYTVTLKDSLGRAIADAEVTLNVKGKTYVAITNGDGKATFKIKNLGKKGKYTAVVAYAGDARHNNVTAKAKLTVKVTWKTISKGSKQKAMVKKVQKALKKNGYYIKFNDHNLNVDGKFNDYTQMAVKQFQKSKGLKETGKVDYNTAKKLKLI